MSEERYFEKVDWAVAEELGLLKTASNQPPMNQVEIAAKLGISQQSVGHILKTALGKLRKAMIERNLKNGMYRDVILKGK